MNSSAVTAICLRIQWNLSIADTLGLDIYGHFCCNIEVFLFQRLKVYWLRLLGPKFLSFLWRFYLLSTYFGGFVKRGSTVVILLFP